MFKFIPSGTQDGLPVRQPHYFSFECGAANGSQKIG
jgi:hypothetical protein